MRATTALLSSNAPVYSCVGHIALLGDQVVVAAALDDATVAQTAIASEL